MYVTYSELIQIGIFICALVGFVLYNFQGKTKIAAITAIMTAVNKTVV